MSYLKSGCISNKGFNRISFFGYQKLLWTDFMTNKDYTRIISIKSVALWWTTDNLYFKTNEKNCINDRFKKLIKTGEECLSWSNVEHN